MSVLNAVEAVPSRLIGIHRFLSNCEGEAAKRPYVLAALIGKDRPTVVESCIRESIRLNMTSEEDGVIRLLKRAESQDLDGMRDYFFKLLAQSEENEDLMMGIAWILAQPPAFSGLQEVVDGASASEKETLGLSKSLRTDQLRYWAEFLGFARRVGDAFFPDASGYLLRHLLRNRPAGRNEQSLVEIRKAIAKECPPWDGGSAWSKVSALLSPVPSNTMRFSESIAWLRLKHEGYIDLLKLGDGVKVQLSAFDLPENEFATHVRWRNG